ncbi:hypothetical protein [Bacillus sp. FJAT-27986]|uniref:hypothetical protein n=1 Tax=Bacillus sp. FJAT-27986 TaxID=1743146 RepID=UPI00080ADD97|nr:hypothetical protein [Bacillus sp. FJAT-27986]OCA86594.1 hypothetical protein A8L44_04665 [Bacillus sp. FJAT-27986]
MDEGQEKLIKDMVEEQVKQYFEQIENNFSAVLKNENGNASVKQSGNGIVYIDNTGIAYAMILFYQYFIGKNDDKIDIDSLFIRLDALLDENRKSFKDLIKSINSEAD